MRPVQRIAAVAAIGLGFTGLGPAVTAARPWDVDRHARPDALRSITQDRAPASLAALAAGDQQPAADEDIGLPLFLPYGASGHILRYAVATSRPPTAEPEPTDARTRVPTAPAPGTPWIITATPGPTQTPWVVTATPAGERTNTPRPTGADITNTPRPTEMERTNTPRPTEADRTATPRPTEADRTATPQPTGSDRTATPRPRQTEFYPTPTPIFTGPVAPAQGPRLFKSGPLQITADGRWLWVADAHSNSVSRIDTESHDVRSFRTSDTPGGDNLKGLSVMENGSEVWATAHDTDRVYVLDGVSGAMKATLQLPWGCGPYGIALSPPVDGRQGWALVSCIRAESLIAINTSSRDQIRLAPVFRSPFGIAWTGNQEAWVTHLYPDDEHPHITGVTFGEGGPKVSSHLWFFAASPRDPGKLSDPVAEHNVAEGGYLNFRGHPARFPGDKNQLWIPSQYHNMHPDRYTPDSTIEASLRRFDLGTHKLSVDDKVILTAPQVHDPTKGDNNPPWIGYGWNATVSGLVDIGFSRVGDRLYTALLAEQSDELILMPADTAPIKSKTDKNAPGLPEVRVGKRPMGLVAHPTKALAYTYNSYSWDVSEVDLSDPARPRERQRMIVGAPEAWSPIALRTLRTGGTLFYTSADPRISVNEKVSCATCHINAEHDGRSWAFHALPNGTAGQGHGMRNVQTLLGLGDTFNSGQRDSKYGWGQLHHSGDRDEIQDFEHTFTSPLMGAKGFLGQAAQPELGPANGGRNVELDSLAAYLMNLKALPRSPYRQADGQLSEAAVRGAASFLGADPQRKPADADCAGCHVPETAFLDHGFHDIGRRRDSNEKELNDSGRRGRCLWCVNTATLVGVWDTAPYDGVSAWAATLSDVVEDLGSAGRPAPHGAVAQLSGRQRADLEAFLGSIDGSLKAADVRSLRDRTPPQIARVSVTSLTRLEVWFSEAVDRAAAADPSGWRVVRQRDGQAMPVSSVAWDAQNGDRVSLTTQLAVGEAYRLQVTGAIRDLADQASGGVANVLIGAADANQPRFEVGELLTVTLGASGYENLTIPVHDASPVGPGLATWSNDRLQLNIAGDARIPGFVRFEWQAAMKQEAGLTVDDRLVAASFSATGWAGDAQAVEIRRVLQSWSDPVSGGDWNQNPTGGPTWRDHSHPDKPWNQAGASKLGSAGNRVADYDGEWDLAGEPDLTLNVPVVNAPVRFAGEQVTQAFRFWLEHPQQDHGYALRLTSSRVSPLLSFRRWEENRRSAGPVLTLTYRP
ncbi:MAG: Ig-like domain-containing protein [Ardenticatenia bacterium]|nr:Ig-like domain-containing protein [Ardenticatenia bacterium]